MLRTFGHRLLDLSTADHDDLRLSFDQIVVFTRVVDKIVEFLASQSFG